MRGRALARAGLFLLTAFAARTDAAAQSIAPRDVERGITVATRPRPDFDPLGIRFGGFRLDGRAAAGLGYDSNVFGRSSGRVGDGYATEAASLDLASDWTTHALGVGATMEARQHVEESTLDWTDWSAGGFGRYDLSADTSVNAAYRHYRQHLDVYSSDVQSAGIFRPVPYDSDEVQVGASTRLNRLGLLATGSFRTYRFDDPGAFGPALNASVNDFDTWVGALGASWALQPGRFVTAVVRVQDIAYTDGAFRDRDSFTWEGLAGFQYDFDGVWQARLALGWRQRDYEGAQFKSLSGPAVEGAVTWAPTLLTTVRVDLGSSIEESIRQDTASYRRFTAGLTVDHEVRRNVILSGEARLERREYENPDQTVTDGLFGVGFTWLVNRTLALVGTYSFYTRLDTSGGLQEWDRNLVQLRLRVAL